MRAETLLEPSPGASVQRPALVLAGAIGNALEWYDFTSYGFLAAVFAKNFFPGDDAFVGLMSAFGLFAASFFVRPLGGILIGDIGDRFGHTRALYLSALLMTVSTVSIALLPTYAMAGAAAPVMLLVLRLLQGVSVGGEQVMSAVFLGEGAAPARRGLMASLAGAGTHTGILLGSGVSALVASALTSEQMIAWGWRLPFLAGLALGGVALVLRRSSLSQGSPHRAARRREPPVVVAMRDHWRTIVHAGGMTVGVGVLFYMIFIYLSTYMQQVDGMPARLALEINTLSMALVLVAGCAFAALSDRVGRKPVMLAGLAGLVVLSWPLFRMLSSGSAEWVLVGQIVFAIFISAYGGPMPAALVEMFHRDTRCTSYSLAWNVAVGWVGGVTPMAAVTLIHAFGSPMAPAPLVIVLSLVSLVAVARMKDRTGGPI